MGGRARGRGAGGRGGAGRGLGRKTSSATSAPRPAAPDATSTKKQMTHLATLLGPRHEASALFTPRRPAVLAADVIKWRSGEDGEKADTSKNLSVDELLNKLTYSKSLLSST